MQDVRSNYHDTNDARNPFVEFAERVRSRRPLKAAATNERKRKAAAASTVEALMFCLRERGTAALKQPKVSRRVSELSEPQMHEVCARLQKLKPEIARAWSVNEVEKLVNAWAVYHE
jgi:transposase